MEEEKKPTWEEIMQQPWVQAARGLLQFVGGGLVALRHETKDAPERDILETLADLGLGNNHAGDVRRGWDAAAGAPPAGSQPAAPTTPERAVPSLSFDDFVRGAAEFGVVPLADISGRTQSPATTPVPSATSSNGAAVGVPVAEIQSKPEVIRVPMSLEELVRSAPPARSSSGASATSVSAATGPASESSTRLREEQDRIVDERIGRLEERLRVLTEALSSNGLEQHEGAAEELAAVVAPAMSTDLGPQAPGTKSSVEQEHGGPEVQRESAETGDISTVVQGPWSKSQHPVAAEQRASNSNPSDTRDRKIEQLERTLGTFEKMVEGIVARSRAKGQPPP